MNKDLFNILIPASKVERTINNIRELKRDSNLDDKIKNNILKAELFIAVRSCEETIHADNGFLCELSRIVFDNIYSDAGKLRKSSRVYRYKNSCFTGVNPNMISFELEKCFEIVKNSFENGSLKLRSKLALLAFAYTTILRIHPFNDGNEKIARLYSNYLGLKFDFNMFDIAPSKTDKDAFEKYLSELRLADSGMLEFLTFRIKKAINTSKKNIDFPCIGPSACLAD